jgi:SAM-dependent methyltransferase
VEVEGWTTNINTDVAHPARMYDYYLGGKDNFPADREAAEQALAASPAVRDMARQNRAFLQRVVRFLAREAGIRQFLDIGTGLPTQGNVHEIAQAIAPDARVVYVDNDPIVVVHSDALLAGHNTTAMQADLREPDAILERPEVREAIDFDQPVAILVVAVLHFIQDAEDPVGIVARLRNAMAPGSYLAISHGTTDLPKADPKVAARVVSAYRRTSAPVVLRTCAQIERFLDGFELVDPGLVQIQCWRPDGPIGNVPGGIYGAVGRRP